MRAPRKVVRQGVLEPQSIRAQWGNRGAELHSDPSGAIQRIGARGGIQTQIPDLSDPADPTALPCFLMSWDLNDSWICQGDRSEGILEGAQQG